MLKPGYEAILEDEGNPNVYGEWSSQYEADSMRRGYSGHKSVVSKWCSLYNTPPSITPPHDGSTTPNTIQHKLFDAGCGTGFIAEELSHLISDNTVELYGGDLCQDMLNIATAKKLYKELRIVDLNETIPYPPDSFDSILCAGVFLQGHCNCGPQCLPNLIRILKRGGYLIATVRYEFYEQTREEWKRQVETCNCELIEDNFMPYLTAAKGVVMVIRKK